MAISSLQFPITNDGAETVRNIKNEFLSVVTVNRQSGDDFRKNRGFGFYSGVNAKQWDDNSLGMLEEQGRPAHTFNITQGIIDDVLGQLYENPFVTKFIPRFQNKTDEIDLIQALYNYDYDRGQWEKQWIDFLRDGLIYKGVLKFFVDFTHDKRGNVGMKTMNPSFIWEDYMWQTDDIKDCRYIINTTWMTAAQIKKDYRIKSAEIDDRIQQTLWAKQIGSEPVNKAADTDPQFRDFRNNQYNVIEMVWTERVKKRKAISTETGRIDEGFTRENVELEDNDFQAMMNLQGKALKIEKNEESVTRMVTVAPGISNDLVLQEGDYPLQLGVLPYITWSSKNLYGERQGLPDLIADAQIVVNKRESSATHLLGTAGVNNYLVESDAFAGDSDELDRFKRDSTKGGQVFQVEPGTNRENKIKIQERGAPPNDLWAASDRAEKMAFSMAGVPAALRGQSEGSRESSLIFDSKKNAANVRLALYSVDLRSKMQQMGENYFYSSKQVYTDPRSVFDKKKRREILLNTTSVLPDGEIAVVNDIRKIKRHEVLIEESRLGSTKRNEMLSKFIELSRTMTNPLNRAKYETEIGKLTNLPEDVVEEMGENAKLFEEFQKKQMELQVLNMDVQIQQIKTQLGAAGEQQPGQQPGQELLDANETAKLPGLGQIPGNIGIAGRESAANNAGSAPSDIVG